ncbi:HD domain-containing protein [uncultured Pseudacidovorax sp.]|uniref:HD domain-containing protein n=1 Tax=uncultured Pseudacidovorax sp. TaxID=679313 RepID=UPI0025D51889|nr:HD domain-containing protein [uncultured Pseudacidovorax sp.]
MTYSPMRMFDPLYGRVDLDDLESQLVLAPEFQRLRCIRMCNINSMLVSGASEISRFEHSVGVLKLAQSWCRKNGAAGDDSVVMRAAALLHDVQTGPFGHSLQYVVEDNKVDGSFVHDDIYYGYKQQYHQRLLATASYKGTVFSTPSILSRLWPRVAEAIKGAGKFGPLISGTLDLDNLDNVVRLAYHVGVATTEDGKNLPTLATQLAVVEGQLSASREVIPLIERWQQIRHRLYDLLLHDWAEFSAKAMLTYAIEKAYEATLLDQQSWLLTDSGLLDHLESKGVGEHQTIGEVIRRIRAGALYQPLLLASTEDVNLYRLMSTTESKRLLERKVFDRLKAEGRSVGRPLVHFILDHKKTSRAVRLRIDGGNSTIEIGKNSKRLLIGLFSPSDTTPTNKEIAAAALEDVLREHSNVQISRLHDPMDEVLTSDTKSPLQLDLGLS